MSYIELVIRIPYHYYENNIKKELPIILSEDNIIASLPKRHGRIMDVDKIIKKMEEREERLKDDRSMWKTAGVETAVDMFGETIIEADRSEEE